MTVLREVREVDTFRQLKDSPSSFRIPQVVDNVLKEPGLPDLVLYNRAKALLLVGAIFKSTQPDESDEERRELERCEASFLRI